ncbi:DsbA family protein [Lacticaseibacillus jixiensis]|uniref:DsbA family protein n=1 Tax=Lacticaseibacillus jixiensis TaxID=3231926 RepID=UPI0036F27DDC
MLEVFLFVNPIGMRCRDAEAAVTRLSEESNTRVDLHFIMLLNFEVISQFMQHHHLDPMDLTLRNHLFDTAHQVALDYKAAQLQGNRLARTLLMAEQEMFSDGILRYDAAFAQACVRGYGLNWERFQRDRAAQPVLNCFATDQNIAREMGITQAPSTVILNHNIPDLPGVAVANLDDYETLRALCDRITRNPPQAAPMLRVL